MNAELLAFVDLLWLLLTTPRSGVLIALLVVAAGFDFTTRRIPNWLVLVGTALALLLAGLERGAASIGVSGALQGFAVGLLAFLPLYLLRAMGAGDVKLMAMAGAFLGLPQTLYAVVATFLAGGLLSLAWLLWRRSLRVALANIVSLLHGALLDALGRRRPTLQIENAASTGRLPYGLAIAGGTTGYLLLRQLGYLA